MPQVEKTMNRIQVLSRQFLSENETTKATKSMQDITNSLLENCRSEQVVKSLSILDSSKDVNPHLFHRMLLQRTEILLGEFRRTSYKVDTDTIGKAHLDYLKYQNAMTVMLKKQNIIDYLLLNLYGVSQVLKEKDFYLKNDMITQYGVDILQKYRDNIYDKMSASQMKSALELFMEL
jgi:hypothetical protein